MKKYLGIIAAALLSVSAIVNAGQDVVAASAVRAATYTSSDIYKTTERVVHIIVRVTAVPGGDTVTPKIQAKDVTGGYYDLLVGTTSATTGTQVLKLGQGIGIVAAGAAADMIPDMYRVIVTHSAGSNFTYSISRNTGN